MCLRLIRLAMKAMADRLLPELFMTVRHEITQAQAGQAYVHRVLTDGTASSPATRLVIAMYRRLQ